MKSNSKFAAKFFLFVLLIFIISCAKHEEKKSEFGLVIHGGAGSVVKGQFTTEQEKEYEMSEEMKKVLMSDKEAWRNFQNFSRGGQNTYIFWVNYAKREETKKKRMHIVLERAKKNMPPGLG